MSKSPELQRALAVMREQLQYVVQSKDPTAYGEAAEWHTRWDIGQVQGKRAAYEVMLHNRDKNPKLKWRLMQRNEADVYEQGVEVGKRIIAAARSRQQRLPLQYMPEHM